MAARRGIKNQKVITQIAIATMKLIIVRTPTDQIIPELEVRFPQLAPRAVQPTPVATTPVATTPVATTPTQQFQQNPLG